VDKKVLLIFSIVRIGIKTLLKLWDWFLPIAIGIQNLDIEDT
jgi:hypothetical protein